MENEWEDYKIDRKTLKIKKRLKNEGRYIKN